MLLLLQPAPITRRISPPQPDQSEKPFKSGSSEGETMKTARAFRQLFGLALLACVSLALPASGGAFRSAENSSLIPEGAVPLTSFSGDEYSPDLGYDPDLDFFLLTYGRTINLGDVFYHTIEAQFVNSEGNPVYGPITLSGSTPPPRDNPSAAYKTGSYEFLVIWDAYFSETDHNIYARRVSDGGATIGSEIAVDTSTADDQPPRPGLQPGFRGVPGGMGALPGRPVRDLRPEAGCKWSADNRGRVLYCRRFYRRIWSGGQRQPKYRRIPGGLAPAD